MNKNQRPKRLKRLCQNLLLAAVTLLVCFGLLEIGLRIAGYGNLEIYQPDPKLYWRLKPNQDCYTKIARQPVHINSHGTRGPEFGAERQPGSLRILSLGDSRTFGWGLSEAETYSVLTEKLLQKHLGKEQRVEVINGGVNAWSYQQMLVFYREFASAWRPDVVVLAEANLWTQFSEDNSETFVRKFMSRVRLKNLLRRFATYHYVVEVKLRGLYERHRTKFIPVNPDQDPLFKEQQQDDPDQAFRQAISNLCSLVLTNGAQPILLFIPMLEDLESTNTSRVLKSKRAVARSLGAPLVDATPALAAGGKSLYLEDDPVHLNSTGNELIANTLFQSMTNYLAP